jgi:anaerobic carbon-monoxide dehydrogenase iron sulfur subunit
MKQAWKIDPEKCSGCRTCEVVCSLFHHGEVNPDRSCIRIVKWEEKGLDVPVVCQHCEIPVCMENCPSGALRRDEKTDAVLYHPEACIGCKLCVLTCPLGGITQGLDGTMLKCDLCGGDPCCAASCITKAIEYLPSPRVGEKQRRRAAKALVQEALSQRDP